MEVLGHPHTPVGLTIGKAAQAAGLTARAIRYYEAEGLTPRPQRQRSNQYREYGPDDVRRLRFIRKAQGLGFSLADIGILLSLEGGRSTDCSVVRKQAELHLNKVTQQIADLERFRQILADVVCKCAATPAKKGCPFIDSLLDEA